MWEGLLTLEPFLKKIIGSIAVLIIAIGITFIFSDCNESQKRLGPEKIISVDKHSDTRIFITYKDRNSQTYKETIHQSNKFRCGDIVIDPHDFLGTYGGEMPYGPFDAGKYAEYRKIKNQK